VLYLLKGGNRDERKEKRGPCLLELGGPGKAKKKKNTHHQREKRDNHKGKGGGATLRGPVKKKRVLQRNAESKQGKFGNRSTGNMRDESLGQPYVVRK